MIEILKHDPRIWMVVIILWAITVFGIIAVVSELKNR